MAIPRNEYVLPQPSNKIIRRPMNHVGKAFLFEIILIFVCTVIMLIIQEIGKMSINSNSFMVVITLLSGIIPFVMCGKRTGVTNKSLWNKGSIVIRDIVCYGAIVMASMSLASYSSILIDAALKPFGLAIKVPDILSFPKGSIGIVMIQIVYVCIIAPILEEYIFRGIVLNSIRSYGDTFAIVTSSILFGIVHGNLIQMPYALVCGLFLGVLAIKAGSIVPGIIIHGFVNTYSTVMSGIATSFPQYEKILMWGSEILIFAVAIIVIFLRHKKGEKLVWFTNSNTPYKGKGIKMLLTSWPMLTALIIFSGVCITYLKTI